MAAAEENLVGTHDHGPEIGLGIGGGLLLGAGGAAIGVAAGMGPADKNQGKRELVGGIVGGLIGSAVGALAFPFWNDEGKIRRLRQKLSSGARDFAQRGRKRPHRYQPTEL